MSKISIKTTNLSIVADLFETPTAEAIYDALPLKGSASRWGDEIYFGIPVKLETETDARADVAVGELGYWPAGSAFCIFFGPTPASSDARPRAASPVNVFGKVLQDASVLKSIESGTEISIEKH